MMDNILEIISIAAPFSAAVAIGACMCYCVVAGRVRALTSRVQQLEEMRDMQDPRQIPSVYPVPAHSYIRMPVLLPQPPLQQQQPSSTYW